MIKNKTRTDIRPGTTTDIRLIAALSSTWLDQMVLRFMSIQIYLDKSDER